MDTIIKDINILTDYTQYFNITKSNIKELIHTYGQQNIIDGVVTLMNIHKIPYPYAHYFIDETSILYKAHKLSQFKDSWCYERFSINDKEQPPTPFRLGFKRPGNSNRQFMLYLPNVDDYHNIDNLTCVFTDQSRMSSHRFVDNIETFSPESGWSKYREYVKDAVESVINNNQDINAYNLREGLYISSKRKGCPYTECAHERLCFLSLVFNEIINLTGNMPLRVFDACAGWGDRLIMSMVLKADRYVGVEPNSKSTDGFNRAITLLGNNDKHQIICDGCPNVNLPIDCSDGSFSIVFLSPPAFNSEFYSNDSKQSVLEFCEFDNWLLGFLIPTIDLCWRKLNIGGVLVIQSLLSAKINSYIETYCNSSEYIGTLAIKTGRNRNKPLWIWKKTLHTNVKPNKKEIEIVLGINILNHLENHTR
jgi:hypothetical protein